MNTKKATKRALLTSVMALVMCVVMLVGTTFAWFTDTASTGVNKIQAGNLKVDIVKADLDNTGKYPSLTGEGSALSFVKAPGAENERILWEPGCTYQTEGFRIQSKGNLALKWKIQINKSWTAEVEQHGHELLDVIDFSIIDVTNNSEISLNDFEGHLNDVDDVSGVYKLQGKVKTTAGNEYKGLVLENVTITVFATQDTVEHDSFTNDYDADAKNPQVTNQKEFLTALNSAVDGQTIYLAAGEYGEINMYDAFKNPGVKDIKLVGADGTSIGLWFMSPVNSAIEGWTFENINFVGADYGLTFHGVDTKDITVKNCTFTGGRFASVSSATTTNLTIESCTFKDTAYEDNDTGRRSAVNITNNNGVTIKNCKFDNAGYNAIQIGAMQGNVTIEGNTIDGTHDRALRFTKAAANGGVTLAIKNNTITNANKNGEVLKADGVNYTITRTGNTWDGADDNTGVTETNENGTYIVKKSSN